MRVVRYISAAAMPAFASCFILSRPLFSTSRSLLAINQFPSLRAPSTSPELRLSMSTGGDTVVAGMEKKIRAALNPVKLEITPAYGDPNGSHVTISVVSDAFEGKRSVQRQQMVYKIIWEEMQGAVHAVDSMTVQTPGEAGM